MKVAGIITEYNPFHNGHVLHIQKTKELTDADFIIAVMSGNFVQRGEPAIMNKYLRTRIALEAGADLVIELPAPFSCASAEYFAGSAVSILNNLGVVDSLVFGSECGDIATLNKAAELLLGENSDFKAVLADVLKDGLSYPLAVTTALKETGHNDIADVISEPNNLLGIEYIKALKQLDSDITPLTYSRIGSYNSEELSETYSSASAIRAALKEATDNLSSTIPADICNAVPEYAAKIMREHFGVDFPVYADDFTNQLFYMLLSEPSGSFTKYADVSADIENRIKKSHKKAYSFSTLVDGAKTKAFTRARISRALIHIMLNISEESMSYYKTHNYATYARVLGFRKDSYQLLTEIKKQSSIPLLSKVADYENILGKKDCSILRKEIYASNLYEAAVSAKYKKAPQANEFTQGVIIV